MTITALSQLSRLYCTVSVVLSQLSQHNHGFIVPIAVLLRLLQLYRASYRSVTTIAGLLRLLQLCRNYHGSIMALSCDSITILSQYSLLPQLYCNMLTTVVALHNSLYRDSCDCHDNLGSMRALL